MSEEDLFDPDGSEGQELAQAPAPGSGTDWEQEAKKAFAERDKARFDLRRMRIQSEYGADIAELIPEALPPKEWEGYADKLKALRGVADKPNPTEQATTEEPPGEAAPPAEQLEAEQRLAAVAGQAPGAPASAAPTLSAKEILEIGKRDPARATAEMQAKYRS